MTPEGPPQTGREPVEATSGAGASPAAAGSSADPIGQEPGTRPAPPHPTRGTASVPGIRSTPTTPWSGTPSAAPRADAGPGVRAAGQSGPPEGHTYPGSVHSGANGHSGPPHSGPPHSGHTHAGPPESSPDNGAGSGWVTPEAYPPPAVPYGAPNAPSQFAVPAVPSFVPPALERHAPPALPRRTAAPGRAPAPGPDGQDGNLPAGYGPRPADGPAGPVGPTPQAEPGRTAAAPQHSAPPPSGWEPPHRPADAPPPNGTGQSTPDRAGASVPHGGDGTAPGTTAPNGSPYGGRHHPPVDTAPAGPSEVQSPWSPPPVMPSVMPSPAPSSPPVHPPHSGPPPYRSAAVGDPPANAAPAPPPAADPPSPFAGQGVRVPGATLIDLPDAPLPMDPHSRDGRGRSAEPPQLRSVDGSAGRARSGEYPAASRATSAEYPAASGEYPARRPGGFAGPGGKEPAAPAPAEPAYPAAQEAGSGYRSAAEPAETAVPQPRLPTGSPAALRVDPRSPEESGPPARAVSASAVVPTSSRVAPPAEPEPLPARPSATQPRIYGRPVRDGSAPGGGVLLPEPATPATPHPPAYASTPEPNSQPTSVAPPARPFEPDPPARPFEPDPPARPFPLDPPAGRFGLDPQGRPFDASTPPLKPPARPFDPSTPPPDPQARPFDASARTPVGPGARPFSPSAPPYRPDPRAADPTAPPYGERTQDIAHRMSAGADHDRPTDGAPVADPVVPAPALSSFLPPGLPVERDLRNGRTFGPPGRRDSAIDGAPGNGAVPGEPTAYGTPTVPPPAAFPGEPAGRRDLPGEDRTGRLDAFKPEAEPAPQPEPTPHVRSGWVLLAVLAGAVLLVALPLFLVWLAADGSDDTFDVQPGACVKQIGTSAARADCTDPDAFTVVSKVDSQERCTDLTQPFIRVPVGDSRFEVLCLKKARP